VTEVRLSFRRPPRVGFLGGIGHAEPNQIVLRVDPSPGLRAALISRGAGQRGWQQVHLDLSFEQLVGPVPEPYERLLYAAMNGDSRLFSREDAVEETWRVVEPLLDNPPPVHSYAQGSWGPEQAGQICRGFADWHEPWLPGNSG
jgi:glucose-6-phosphate 1-dehydrogenase